MNMRRLKRRACARQGEQQLIGRILGRAMARVVIRLMDRAALRIVRRYHDDRRHFIEMCLEVGNESFPAQATG